MFRTDHVSPAPLRGRVSIRISLVGPALPEVPEDGEDTDASVPATSVQALCLPDKGGLELTSSKPETR